MGRTKWREYQETVLSSCRTDESIPMESKDWQPADKCNLCQENKTACSDAATLPRPASESGSVSSGGESEPLTEAMTTTLESAVASSMAASLAAVAALTSGKQACPLFPGHSFLPPWYLTSAESARKADSPMVMPLPPSASEQPLDLSSKTSTAASASKSPESPVDVPSNLQHLIPSSPSGVTTQSLKVPTLSRQIFKAKPRLSAVAGRRTYTEEELQAALRDIQSGKLGTRRAAVIYGIPRSTLRNKVYKLAMERERDTHLLLPAPPDKVDEEVEDEEDERDLSGAEEEREVEKALMKPLFSMDDLVRMSTENPALLGNPESIKSLLQHRYLGKEDTFSVLPPGTDVWSGLDHSALGPYISQLLAGSLVHPSNPFVANRTSPGEQTTPEGSSEYLPKLQPIPDLVRRMMVGDRLLLGEQPKKDRNFQLNGSRQSDPGPSSSRLSQETNREETSGSSTPPNVILRIPSYRPASKNGVQGESTPLHSSFSLGVKVGDSSQHSVVSPPISGTRSESSSPPSMIGKGIGVSLKDVIAKSISQKFQQPPDLQHLQLTPPGLDPFRRSEYLTCNPPIIRNHNNNHLEDRKIMAGQNAKHTSVPTSTNSGSSTSASGKGTRPKRGKYRNYDRDSLVEAVRAVQRGEMSVHRAGSYYGVPHSTLEYKVKERHLMRPRKREPKAPQPEEIKRKDDGNILRMSPGGEKSKPLPPKPPKTTFAASAPLPAGPNGLKIPSLFDQPIAFTTTPPFPFWPPNPFHHLPMDYPRGPNFSPNPDQFFASQMIQRLQEDTNSKQSQSPPPSLGKTTREMAESLYDGSGTSGSFLDGIIRSSLETGLPLKTREESSGTKDQSGKSLLDQLCRNSRLAPLVCDEIKTEAEDTSPQTEEMSPSTEHLPTSEQDVTEEKSSSTPIPTDTNPSDTTSSEINKVDDESACDRLKTVKNVDNADLAKEDEDDTES